MKVVYNDFIPFKKFFAINLFGVMFVRNEYKKVKISKKTFNHESIHTAQALDFVLGCEKMKLLGYVIFYLLYLIEWLLKAICYIFTFGKTKPYKGVSFEREAYKNQHDYKYLNARKKFSWCKYVFKLYWK